MMGARMICALAVLACAAIGTAARPAGHVLSLHEEAPAPLPAAHRCGVAEGEAFDHSLLARAFNGSNGGKLVVRCNGKKPDIDEDDAEGFRNYMETKGPYFCIGVFKLFGKYKGDEVKAVAGFKCEGSYTAVLKGGYLFAACEGLKKKGAAIFVKKAEGAVKVVKYGGSLGTSSIFAALPEKNESAARVEAMWPAFVPKAFADSEVDAGEALGATLDDKNVTFVARNVGRGGGGKVVTIFGAGVAVAEPELDSYEALEADMATTLKDAGVPMPPAASGYWPSTSSALPGGEAGGNGVSITCNGRAAYFKGRLPCFGKLSVFGGKGPLKFGGQCKGLWTGFLGKKCLGFSWNAKKYEEYGKGGFCAGKAGFYFKKKGSKIAKGGSCKGKAFFAKTIEE